jgi:N-acyl homoserine lactone hydrolase
MRLYLLQLALMGGGAPAPGYLIQTDDGTNILVDTGYPRSMVGAHRQPGAAGPRIEEEDYVVNRLASVGVAPEDITYLVCTHFDGDHAGSHDAFPDAEMVVQREHYTVAREHPRFANTRERWDRPGARLRLVDGDTELVPGVELIESGGHVPGHQAVLVRLPKTGPVLLAIDAINSASQLDPDTRSIGSYDMDEAGVRASTRKLTDLAKREGVTLIVHGHDAQQWPTLKHAPEYYD